MKHRDNSGAIIASDLAFSTALKFQANTSGIL